jgi:hypothetical protein
MEEVACTAAKYISQFIAIPGYAYFDDLRSSYPFHIEIVYSKNKLTRVFILKETKNECSSFLNVWDKFYTIIDNETSKPINFPRDMFTELVSEIYFEQLQAPEIKRKNPEISVPMGGAVKVRKKK